MSTQHTSGPWRSRPHLGGYWIDAPAIPDGLGGVQVVATVGELADARLITAAPDLLAALKAMVAASREQDPTSLAMRVDTARAEIAEPAIAKVEGD